MSKIYEARPKGRKYEGKALWPSGRGATEEEAIYRLMKTMNKSCDCVEDYRQFCVVDIIDIKDEIDREKQKCDKALNKIEEILNTIPKYNQKICIHDKNVKGVPINRYISSIYHNLSEIKEKINQIYINTINGSIEYVNDSEWLNMRYYITKNFHLIYCRSSNSGGNPLFGTARYEHKPVITFKFVDPMIDDERDQFSLKYFGNFENNFVFDLNSKYATEIFAGSFMARGYHE